jgi:hypothetical protein
MRAFRVPVTVLGAIGICLSAAAPASALTSGCAIQSGANFPTAFTGRANLALGPLVFMNLRDAATYTAQDLKRFGGFKSPAVLLAGRTAVVSIDPPARRHVRLSYWFDRNGNGQRSFRRMPHAVRFVSCDRRRAQSTAGGKPATFWSGFFVVKGGPICVPLHISIDGRPPVAVTVGIARSDCPPAPAARSAGG